MSDKADFANVPKWETARELLTQTDELSLDDLSHLSEAERESIRLALDELDDLGVVSATDNQTWELTHAV